MERPLPAIAKAFQELEKEVEKGGEAMISVADFAHACSLISVLFGCLGMAFKFAEKDYVSKVQDLSKAADEFESLPAMIDYDIRNNSVRDGGSHTRNLLRVLRGVDMVRLLFQQILITEGNTLKGPASKAYDQVFARHHSWTIRKAVGAGMFLLPSKSQFLKKLNEEEDDARVHIQGYATSSGPIVQYVTHLFLSKDLGTEW